MNQKVFLRIVAYIIACFVISSIAIILEEKFYSKEVNFKDILKVFPKRWLSIFLTKLGLLLYEQVSYRVL